MRKFLLLNLLLGITQFTFAQVSNQNKAQKTDHSSRYSNEPKAEAETSHFPKTASAQIKEANKVVHLKCNTNGMSANQIMLREVTAADFEISQIENSGNHPAKTTRLNELQSFRGSQIQALVNSMTDNDFLNLNQEEQSFFIAECKALDAEKANHFFTVFKSNYRK